MFDFHAPVNSYGHVKMVSSLFQTFSWASLAKAINQYFMYLL